MVDGKEGLNRKNLTDLMFIFILAVSIIFMFSFITAWQSSVLGNTDESKYNAVNYSLKMGLPNGVNEDKGHVYNISVNSTAGLLNISTVNITLPAGWELSLNFYDRLTDSNSTFNITNRIMDGALWFGNTTGGGRITLSWNTSGTSNCLVSGNQSLSNATFSFNASAPDPGTYNITVRIVYNWTATGALVYNETNISVRINDTTTPENVSFSWGAGLNRSRGVTSVGNYSGNLILNISTSDNNNAIRSVFFNISYTNSTTNGTKWFFKATNISTSPNYWNYTLDTRMIPDGSYNVTVWVNDSNGNLNNTIQINMSIDNTAPTGSLTCTPANVQVGETVTCSCTSTDNFVGINATRSNSYTASPSTSNTGTFTESCSFEDMAGNAGLASDTYVVELSGGGPSGGTSGPTTTTVTKTASFSEITPETPKIMSGFKAETGVKEIQIEVSETAQNVKVTVEKYESKPTEVSASKTGTYKYLYVETQNLTDKLSKAKMTIQVEKSWISEKAITKEDVALFKYNEDTSKWNELTTSFKEESNTYYYYEVELDSFSYFAIAPKEGVLPEEETPTGGEEEAGFLGLSYWIWIVIGLIVLAIIIGLGIKLKKKKR